MPASTIVSTPFGKVLVRADEDEVVAVHWATAAEARTKIQDTPVLRAAARWLNDYFAGRFRAADFPLRAEGTPFQRRIWQAIAAIPPGETKTYGELARSLKSAPRAVGGACGANPVCIVIPCHRVLAANGGLGGYSGGDGLATKRRLLDHEAAALHRSGRLVA